MFNKRQRGARRGGANNRLRAELRREHRADFRGLNLRGRSDPNRVLFTPWNTITISSLLVGTSTASNVCVTLADLHAQFSLQTGIAAAKLEYRVLSNQAWHITPNGELNNRVRVRYFGLLRSLDVCGVANVLSQQEDFGTPSRNATVRFIWPRTHSSNAFSQDSTAIVMRYTLNASQQLLIHTMVLWRPVGGASTITDVTDMGVSVDPISELYSRPQASELEAGFANLNI